MTPETARALEPGTPPGPWHSLHEEWEDEDGTPCERFNVIAGGDAILETIDFDPANHNPRANTALAAAAPDMRATIAAQTWQWSVERRAENEDGWLIDRPWTCDRELAETWLRKYDDSRLVRRLVGPVEVVEE